MFQYLSFLQDAEERFLESFQLYQTVAAQTESQRTLEPLAQCSRSLYIALEKGFKHALAEIEPHLLLAKPERSLLLELRRDLLARPVPTIFCSRRTFDTLGLLQTWEALNDVSAAALDKQVASDFDRALKRLVEVRHRAQHGELFEDPDELLAVVRQVLGRFEAVSRARSPELLARLYARNGQLQSRLHAIEADVDTSWQVLLDYLSDHAPLRSMLVTMYVIHSEDDDNLHALIGKSAVSVKSAAANSMLGEADVPRSMADGLFLTTLTKQQAQDRYSERMRLRASANPVEVGSLPPGVDGIVPLYPGRIILPATNAWLSLHLAQLTPSQLHVSATLSQLEVTFNEPDEVRGTVAGVLECSVVRPGTHPASVKVSGTAYFDSEWVTESDSDSVSKQPTNRAMHLDLSLSLDDVADSD